MTTEVQKKPEEKKVSAAVQTEPAGTMTLSARPVETQPAVFDVGDLTTVFEPGQMSQAVLQQLELRVNYFERFRTHALKQTTPRQWVRHRSEDGGESLYPMGSAAEAMFSIAGARWRNPRDHNALLHWEKRTDDDGETYYWVESELMVQGQSQGVFAGKRYLGEKVTKDDGTTYRRGFAKTEPDTVLDAFQNLKSQAARTLFGLRDRTIEDVKNMGGPDLTTARIADFQDHKQRTDVADGWTIPGGKSKGTRLADATEKDIRFWMGLFEKDLADQSKARFHEKTKKQLEAFKTELQRRAQGVAPAAPTPTSPADQKKADVELENTWRLIREEGAALGMSEKDVEAGISQCTTLDLAKRSLDSLTKRRIKKEAGAGNEPGSGG